MLTQMKVMISGGFGGGYGMGGSGGGGSGMGMDMMGGEQLNFFQKFLATLPPWLATIVQVAVVVVAAMILGKIIGKIIGGIVYPNPEKASIFDLKHRIVIFLVVVGTIGASVYAVYQSSNPKPTDDLPVGGNMDGGDISVTSPADTSSQPADNLDTSSESSSDVEGTSSELDSNSDVVESSSSEVTSSSSQATPPPATAEGATTPSVQKSSAASSVMLG